MDKSYLPSRLFIIRIVAIFIIIATVFGISKLVKYFKSRPTSKTPAKVTVIGDLVQKDSNNNGIPDWEEYLWGLDPSKNGESNKEFIMSKKKTLALKEGVSEANDNISENELLSRQFFAAIVSLQQTGNLNEESLQAISEAVGKNITTSEIADVYNNSTMKIVEDGTVANKNYYDALSNLAKKYSDRDIGNELTIIIQGFNNQDPQALYAARSIAQSYQEFGREFINIPTPRSLVSTHLSAANNYEKSGLIIYDLTRGLSDPIIAMTAIINYKKYNEALSSDLEKISTFLQ